MPRWRPSYADLSAALAGVERWLLPASCLLCGEPVPPARSGEAEPLVCGLCRLRWRPIPPPLCSRCGQPEPGDGECLICRDWPTGLSRVRSAVWLDGGARQAVHRLKYGGWWRLADAMAGAMRALEPLTGQVFLVPVPLGPKRLRRRGYNQSERLAVALGRELGLPVRPELLARGRETGTQTALTPEARQANVWGAFQIGETSSGALRRQAGRPLVLVDDVFTTGATLIAAASALADAGAVRVEAVTFARAAPPIMNL